jgi:hypothetical protein
LVRIADRFEAIDQTHQLVGRRRRVLADGSPAILKNAFKIRWVNRWYQSKLPQQSGPLAELGGGNASLPAPIQTPDFSFDEEFWRDFLASDGLVQNQETVPLVRPDHHANVP